MNEGGGKFFHYQKNVHSPVSALAKLPRQTNSRNREGTNGDIISMSMPVLFARSAKRRHCLAQLSKLEPCTPQYNNIHKYNNNNINHVYSVYWGTIYNYNYSVKQNVKCEKTSLLGTAVET